MGQVQNQHPPGHPIPVDRWRYFWAWVEILAYGLRRKVSYAKYMIRSQTKHHDTTATQLQHHPRVHELTWTYILCSSCTFLSYPLLLCKLRYGNEKEVQALLAKREEEEAVVQEKVVPWSEPESLNLLLDRYIVEGKFAGRTPGTTLYVVQSRNRSGSVDQCTPDQKFKLFMVTWLIVLSSWFELFSHNCDTSHDAGLTSIFNVMEIKSIPWAYSPTKFSPKR